MRPRGQRWKWGGVCGLLLCVVSMSARAAETGAFSLAQCLRRALAQNVKLRGHEFAVRAAEAQLTEAQAGGWPIFEYEAQTAPIPGDAGAPVRSFFRGDVSWHARGKVNVAVPLYTFGKLSVAQALARQGIAGAQGQQAQEQASLVVKVHQLYYGIQFADEMERLLRDAIARIDEKLAGDEVAPEVEEEGKAKTSPITRLRLKVFRAELAKRVVEARMKRELAREGLRIQMGLPAGSMVRLASSRLTPARRALAPLAAYQTGAVTDRAEARLVEIGVEAKRLQLALERKKAYPDVGIGGFFELGRSVPEVQNVTGDNFTNPFHFTRAGLGVQLRGKFDPHGQRARVTKVESEYLKASVERGLAKEGMQLEVREAYLKARAAWDQLRRVGETQRLANQLTFLTKSNVELGIGDEEEYADALQLQLLTQGQYYEAIFQFNSAIAELEQKAGMFPQVGSDRPLQGLASPPPRAKPPELARTRRWRVGHQRSVIRSPLETGSTSRPPHARRARWIDSHERR
ncbi:MAG: TolC family protein [Deltaproteobacteria bacterium]|nr:TolC family protein [Deltaproteobacteria bacterium]